MSCKGESPTQVTNVRNWSGPVWVTRVFLNKFFPFVKGMSNSGPFA